MLIGYFGIFSAVIFIGFKNSLNIDFSLWAYSVLFFIFLFILLIQQMDSSKMLYALVISNFIVITFGLIQKFVFSLNTAADAPLLLYLGILVGVSLILSAVFVKKRKLHFLVFSGYTVFLALFFLIYIYFLKEKNIDLLSSFSRWERVYSTIGNPNYLSAFIIAILPYFIYLYQKTRSEIMKSFFILNFVLGGLLLFVTKTRGAFFAVIFAWSFVLIKIYIASEKKMQLRKIFLKYLIFLSAISIPLIFILGINRDIQNMTRRFSNIKYDHNIRTRYQTWLIAADIARRFPLFGGGLDNYQSYYPFTQNRIIRIVRQKGMSSQEKRAHSEYLQFLAETGVLGAALFIILLLMLYKKTKFTAGNIKVYAFTSILALYIHSFVSFPLHILPVLIVFSLGVSIIFTPDLELGISSITKTIVIPLLFVTLIPQFKFFQAMRHTKYAEFYRSQSDWNNAIFYLKKATGEFAPLGISYHYLGTAYYMLNDYKDAENSFRKALQYKLRQEYLFANFGNILTDEKKYNLAQDMYRQGIFIAPQYDVNYYNLGNLFQTLDMRKKAEFYYKKGLFIDKTNEDIWYNLGNLYFDMKEYKKSIKSFKAAYKLKPSDSKILNNLAITYYTAGEKDTGIKLFNKIMKDYPENAKAYIDLGSILLKQQEFDKARAVLKKALSIKKSADIYFALGNLEYNKKNYKKSRDYFEKMIDLAPDDPRGYNNEALTQFALGNTGKALQLYKKAIKINPDYSEAQANYRSMLNYLSRKRGGAIQLEQTAYNALTSKNFKKAIDIYKKLLSIPVEGNNFLYKINLGFAYYKLKDYTNAEKFLYAGLTDKNNKYFEKFNSLGNIYYNTNRPDSAIWAYEMESKNNPSDYLAKYNLGAAYLEKNDFKKCYRLWTEIKKYMKNDKDFIRNYNIVKEHVK